MYNKCNIKTRKKSNINFYAGFELPLILSLIIFDFKQ